MNWNVLPTTVAILCAMPCAHAAEPSARTLERDGLKLETAPLQPDQVRAFFLARGFSAADAEHVVTQGCVFRSAIGNAHAEAGAPEVVIALGAWKVTPAGGGARAPRTREDWDADWKTRGVGDDAATAFHWSLFPTEQTFAATDYNWGFLTFGLEPGTRFTLDLVWLSAGRTFTATLEGLECGK
jgi:hypothetical protein